MTASLINDCFLHDKERLKHEEAIQILDERLSGIADVETISTDGALNRITAAIVSAPHDVPLHTNSAVDGYAFKHSDLGDGRLPVSNRIAAGDLNPPSLSASTSARIFTGAPMPPGADSVAMQEDCTETDGIVTIPTTLNPGANCRLVGEDLKSGDLVLDAGTVLRAADLAALASIGFSKVQVFKKLRIALFSNGNEMRISGKKNSELLPGEVYDANQPLLSALCANLPVEISLFGIIRDDANDARTAIEGASIDHDIIITSGGASRGAEDHMLTTLDELGKRHLWQLAVKPGRPMMFGQIIRQQAPNDCLFFGLPGNPVAAMVCFLMYVRPALLKLAGANWLEPPRFKVPTNFSISNKKPDRREFMRGILQTSSDGTLSVKKFARDGSGLISSLREADGLIEIDEEITELKQGELVSFIPFSSIS